MTRPPWEPLQTSCSENAPAQRTHLQSAPQPQLPAVHLHWPGGQHVMTKVNVLKYQSLQDIQKLVTSGLAPHAGSSPGRQHSRIFKEDISCRIAARGPQDSHRHRRIAWSGHATGPGSQSQHDMPSKASLHDGSLTHQRHYGYCSPVAGMLVESGRLRTLEECRTADFLCYSLSCQGHAAHSQQCYCTNVTSGVILSLR